MRNRKQNTRSAFTMIEMIAVLVVAGIAAFYIYSSYRKSRAGEEAKNAAMRATAVVEALENIKDFNSGAYPVSATKKISSLPQISRELGGTSGITDISNWTYKCSAGTSTTVTLTTGALSSADLANMVADRINGQLAPWTASASGNKIKITRANAVCK